MLIRLVRYAKRLVVLFIGIAIVYLAVRKFFPFFDNRVPLALALFATYVFTAYVFIPVVIRVIRIFVRPKHFPTYCITPDGFASDPVNIGVVGTRTELERAFEKAGWYKADKKTLRTSFRLGMSLLLRRPYNHAPFSALYLFGRKQDIGFQKPYTDNPSHRHHVRFWTCNIDWPGAIHDDVAFWQRFHRPNRANLHRQLWVGAASRDIGIMPIRHNAQLTHMIDPDTNAERDLIVEDLRAAHTVAKTITERAHEGLSLPNRVLGGILHADGKIRICILKD